MTDDNNEEANVSTKNGKAKPTSIQSWLRRPGPSARWRLCHALVSVSLDALRAVRELSHGARGAPKALLEELWAVNETTQVVLEEMNDATNARSEGTDAVESRGLFVRVDERNSAGELCFGERSDDGRGVVIRAATAEGDRLLESVGLGPDDHE